MSSIGKVDGPSAGDEYIPSVEDKTNKEEMLTQQFAKKMFPKLFLETQKLNVETEEGIQVEKKISRVDLIKYINKNIETVSEEIKNHNKLIKEYDEGIELIMQIANNIKLISVESSLGIFFGLLKILKLQIDSKFALREYNSILKKVKENRETLEEVFANPEIIQDPEWSGGNLSKAYIRQILSKTLPTPKCDKVRPLIQV